jgi:hypothetical protein
LTVQDDLNHPLPIIQRNAPPHSGLHWASKYLRLPTWASTFVQCDQEEKEVNCADVYLAAKVIEHWETLIRENESTGVVWVNVSNQGTIEMLSMLYQGFQIAIATSRRLATVPGKFSGFALPETIEYVDGIDNGTELPTDYHINCVDVSVESSRDLILSSPFWPQVFYVHPYIGEYLRTNFGYHAAYFMGNFLFGVSIDASNECSPATGAVMDGSNADLIPGYEFILESNGIPLSSVAFLTNSDSVGSGFREVYVLNDSVESVGCALLKLVSADRIVFPLGSPLGFWGTALRGVRRTSVLGSDDIFADLTNSQQGSLWHLRGPIPGGEVYRGTDWLYVCDSNAADVNLFFDYLLW